jgi:hypothetical protein
MGRYLGWAIGLGLVLAATAAPASAQVDVGVWLPNGGARVVVGQPRVYSPRVYAPPVVVVRDDYRWNGNRGRGWKNGKGPKWARDRYYGNYGYGPGYYGYDPRWDGRAAREYRRDVQRADREYQRDIREARRDYERSRRW